MEITTKLHKPLNDAYHRYDFIGFREHTNEEEILAEKEYERCKAEYDKEKKKLDKLYELQKQGKRLFNIQKTFPVMFTTFKPSFYGSPEKVPS